jgi:nicotinamide-nucleotide amidase
LKFSVLSIGTELSLGLILDTNSRYIAETLTDLGLECNCMMTVKDDESDIVDALRVCGKFSDIIIVTGGLGPTEDDLTRSAFAKYIGTGLVRKKSLDKTSLKFFNYVKNEKLIDKLLLQSFIPKGSVAMVPRVGSASGFYYEKSGEVLRGETSSGKISQGKIFFSIPGVPREMKDMFDNDVIPVLGRFLSQPGTRKTEKMPGQDFLIKKAVLFATDIGESQLEYSISSIKPLTLKLGVDLGVTSNPGLVKIMLIARAKTMEECEEKLKTVTGEILDLIGDYIYFCGDGTIGDSIKNTIQKKNKKITLCTAESITGGLISSLITDTPGSSEYFLGSLVSYSNFAKKNLLNIDRKLIAERGAVSSEVCGQMAKNARIMFNSDFAISATGFAGPTVNEEGKSVGLVYTCIEGPDGQTEIHEKKFIGTRADIKFRTAQFILNRLRLLIEGLE